MFNMTKEFKSLDQRLKSEGWKVQRLILTDKLSEELAKVAIEYAGGKYDDLRLIPSDIARDGADWIPVEKSHILYVKRSKAYERELEESQVFFLISPICRYKDTDEQQPIIISGNNP